MKKYSTLLSLFIVLGAIYLSFTATMPQTGTDASTSKTEFSTERALIPLKKISEKPHYHGSINHSEVRRILIQELEALGLETQTQEGTVLSKYGSLIKPINIVARLKGKSSSKSLVLLSHYDSALVPSLGASDAGSGIVTILESLRAYIASEETPLNDIIVVFTDAEEIGLNGAELFVNEHPWAKNIGLVLNFEARGSGGPSNMILETNGGNKNLIKAFANANPEYPVATSLMYSIYKMLPNDTDSTIFREDADIDSFFFAFIDDHFDYHTQNDNLENLNTETLQHQGSYLLPLLHYFAKEDLSQLKAEEDYVYANFPLLKMIYYPFSWITPMLLIATLIFISLLIIGIKKNRLQLKAIGVGFFPFIISLILCGLFGYFGWIILLKIYPHYLEIQHGFTYNGHSYIAFFVLISCAIIFSIYKFFSKAISAENLSITPLFFWILINGAIAVYLQGAAYFIIPVYFGLISLALAIYKPNLNRISYALLALPALGFLSPLVQFFPVGLGLENLVISCVFCVLLFGLLIPVFGPIRIKKIIATTLLCFGIGFYIHAHTTSSFSEERQKPNSLIFYQNNDTQKAYWLTYDSVLDPWTKGYLGENPEKANSYSLGVAASKYGKSYTYISETETKNLQSWVIQKLKDTLIGEDRHIDFTIQSQRKSNNLSVYSPIEFHFKSLKINGIAAKKNNKNEYYLNTRSYSDILVNYLKNGDVPLHISFSVHKDSLPRFTVKEYSFDLLTNPLFSVANRPENMMPKPFIYTDAIIVEKSFSLEEIPIFVNDSINNTLYE